MRLGGVVDDESTVEREEGVQTVAVEIHAVSSTVSMCGMLVEEPASGSAAHTWWAALYDGVLMLYARYGSPKPKYEISIRKAQAIRDRPAPEDDKNQAPYMEIAAHRSEDRRLWVLQAKSVEQAGPWLSLMRACCTKHAQQQAKKPPVTED